MTKSARIVVDPSTSSWTIRTPRSTSSVDEKNVKTSVCCPSLCGRTTRQEGAFDERSRLGISSSTESLQARVDNATLSAKVEDVIGGAGFKLPEKERRMIEKSMKESQQSRTWSGFDSFFGCFLLISCAFVGLSVTYPEYDHVWETADAVFFVIFTIELIARGWWGRRQLRALCRDPWVLFDFFVIAAMAVAFLEDRFVGMVCSGKSCRAALIMIRMFRLIKLTRVLRLFRAFRSLGMLVEGILNALRMLLWTSCLICLILLMAAVVMTRMMKWVVADSDISQVPVEFREQFIAEMNAWPNIYQSVWNLMELMTLDNWTTRLRVMSMGLKGSFGILAISLLCAFMAIAAFGIMKLVVAVMCHAAYAMRKRRLRTRKAEELLAQRNALVRLEKILRTWGERPVLAKADYMSPAEFWTTLEDENVQQCVKDLQLSNAELVDLVRAFDMNGEFEIAGLVEAITTVVLQRYYATFSADLLKLESDHIVRSTDMIFFANALGVVEERTKQLERDTSIGAACVHDLLEHLEERGADCHALFRKRNSSGIADKVSKYYSETAHKNSYDILAENGAYFNSYLDDVQVDLLELRATAPMDGIFGLVILLNGIFIAVQAEVDESHPAVIVVDQTFTLIYIMEFILRVMLLTHFHVVELQHSSENLILIKDSLIYGVFPRWPQGGLMAILSHVPAYVRQPNTFLDTAAMLISMLDSWVLIWLRRSGVTKIDASALLLLRLTRFFRVVKVLRMFKLFPRLTVILQALTSTLGQWIAAVTVICVMVYGKAIFLFSWLNSGATEEGSDEALFFGTFFDCLVTCWQLALLDDWGRILTATASINVAIVPGMMIFTFLIGAGVMNLVVGFMAESAVDVIVLQRHFSDQIDLVEFLRCMDKVRNHLKFRLNLTKISMEMLAMFMAPKWHPDDLVVDRFYGKPVWESFQAAAAVGLKPAMVDQVFKRLDYMRCGEVDVDMFILGMIETRDDLAKINVFSVSRLLRRLWSQQEQVAEKMRHCHNAISRLMIMMHAACVWDDYKHDSASELKGPARGSLSRMHQHAEEAMATLAKKQRAAMDTDEWFDDAENRPMTFQHCQGTVCWSGNRQMLFGRDTDFRRDVKYGDIIVIYEPTSDDGSLLYHGSQGAEREKAVLTSFVVTRVVDKNSMEVCCESLSSVDSRHYTFAVAKRPRNDKARMRHSQSETEGDDVVRLLSAESGSQLRASSKCSTDSQKLKMPVVTESLRIEDLTPRSKKQMLLWDAETLAQKTENIHAMDVEQTSLQNEVDQLLDELFKVRDLMLQRQALGWYVDAVVASKAARGASTSGAKAIAPVGDAPVDDVVSATIISDAAPTGVDGGSTNHADPVLGITSAVINRAIEVVATPLSARSSRNSSKRRSLSQPPESARTPRSAHGPSGPALAALPPPPLAHPAEFGGQKPQFPDVESIAAAAADASSLKPQSARGSGSALLARLRRHPSATMV